MAICNATQQSMSETIIQGLIGMYITVDFLRSAEPVSY